MSGVCGPIAPGKMREELVKNEVRVKNTWPPSPGSPGSPGSGSPVPVDAGVAIRACICAIRAAALSCGGGCCARCGAIGSPGSPDPPGAGSPLSPGSWGSPPPPVAAGPDPVVVHVGRGRVREREREREKGWGRGAACDMPSVRVGVWACGGGVVGGLTDSRGQSPEPSGHTSRPPEVPLAAREEAWVWQNGGMA